MNSVFVTERATRDNPRAFVPYYDLIGDWRAAMTRACAQVGVDPGDLTAPHPVDDFVTTSLNRSAATWDGLTVPDVLVDLAERTWAAAHALVEQPDDADAMAELDALHGDVRRALPHLRRDRLRRDRRRRARRCAPSSRPGWRSRTSASTSCGASCARPRPGSASGAGDGA